MKGGCEDNAPIKSLSLLKNNLLRREEEERVFRVGHDFDSNHNSNPANFD